MPFNNGHKFWDLKLSIIRRFHSENDFIITNQQGQGVPAMESFKRKGCNSLQLLCQIEVIRLLHKKAAALEAEYIDQWSTRDLTGANQVSVKIPDVCE